MTKKIFWTILVLAFILRFYKLGEIPLSLDWDENSNAYNAYSILKTGRDEYGNFLPITNRSFDDYKPPLYMYLNVVTVAIFGLTPFAARLPSAFFGFLTVPAMYFLARKIFEKALRIKKEFGESYIKRKREEFKDRLEYAEGKSLKSQFRVKVTTTGETITEAEEQQVSSIPSIPQKYKIFTLPNCDKCRTAKEYLGGIKIAGEILDLASKDDLKVFREYYKELKNVIKRNEDGSLPVPTVLFFDEKDNVVGTAHNVDDIKKVIQ